VHAIKTSVNAVRGIRAAQGEDWYDGHDVINRLNSDFNRELNDVIDAYPTSVDPVHTATIQIGNYLKNHLGQRKIGVNVSPRRIALRSGESRNGECEVSKWKI